MSFCDDGDDGDLPDCEGLSPLLTSILAPVTIPVIHVKDPISQTKQQGDLHPPST